MAKSCFMGLLLLSACVIFYCVQLQIQQLLLVLILLYRYILFCELLGGGSSGWCYLLTFDNLHLVKTKGLQ